MQNLNKNNPNCAAYLLDNDCGFYVQAYFHAALSLEIKRAEYSRKPFLLMIINVHNLFRNNGGKSILEKIAYLLPSCTRDTDIAGWYDYGSVMGVIFTETNVVNKDLIGEKIYNNLCNILDSEQIKKIEISYHAFPEEYDKPKLDPSWEFTLNSDWQARADYNLSLPAHNGNVNFVAEP